MSLNNNARRAMAFLNRTSSRALREQNGAGVVELALLTPVLLVLLVGAVDMGQACYAAIEVSGAANAGAEYGTQNPTDTSGMQDAALLDASNLSGLTATATWGCECSDGSSASVSCATTPSCSANSVRYVQVVTSMTYVPVLRFPGVPSTLTLKGSARLRVAE